jgi:hypothetical protein
LFTAFLWLTECVIIFISILCLFYLNIFNNNQKNLFFYYFYKYLGLFLSFLLLYITLYYNYNLENNTPYQFFLLFISDNFYEALFNNKLNDFFSLKSSYYIINSCEFIFVGIQLLIASLVCINLNKFKINSKLLNYSNFLLFFNIFNEFLNFYFLRKQNLIDQYNINSVVRFFKKKSAY